ncbi:MAG TPA: tRNA dihydrouridine synthase DusB [Candidatus Dormibacteraeota bacterium]|nr:tRNA dihydrouridine synthase DusB [Candidatus Dormibacteraeota bacterium]
MRIEGATLARDRWSGTGPDAVAAGPPSVMIGALRLRTPIFVAPMAGITDRPFRALARELGAGLTCTEMIAAAAVVRSPEAATALLDLAPDEHPVAAQLVGNDPATMAEAAQICVARGADVVDVNLGCPVSKVVRLGSGAALARDLHRTAEILGAMVAAVPVPVTAKMRLGWDDRHHNAPELARALEDVGVAAVTVHGRTRCQGYRGEADWAAIARVKAAVRAIPVLGSGDVRDSDVVARRIALGDVDGVVIARGLLGDWHFLSHTVSRLTWGVTPPAPTFPERLALARRHWHLLVDHHGERLGVRRCRKFVTWAIKGCAGAARLRQMVAEVNTRDDLDRMYELALLAGEGPQGWHRPVFTSGEG